jgi:DNA end-binding protein Ku
LSAGRVGSAEPVPRAIWTGAISFGLVNVPVGLYSATESKTIHFHQVQERTGRRIRNKRVAEGTGREVDYEDIVKGYETDDGDLIIVTPDELASVEPRRTRTIEVEDFVALDQIDPIAYDRSYYLAPDDGAKKPYALLREAMRRSERVAIARFVMRNKEHLATIRPMEGEDVLVLETMFFGDEIRSPAELEVPGKVELSDRELKIARQLIDTLTTDFDPMAYEDTYRQRVADLVRQKAEGGEVVIAEEEEREEPRNLMKALEASLDDITAARKARERRRELDDLSKSDLQKRAAKAKVEGRSQMSKDELIAALAEAS